MKYNLNLLILVIILFYFLCITDCKNRGISSETTGTRKIIDAIGREVEIPETVQYIICSGAGCLRLLTYLQAQDKIVAVDDAEVRMRKFDARPYALANPQFNPSIPRFSGILMNLTSANSFSIISNVPSTDALSITMISFLL